MAEQLGELLSEGLKTGYGSGGERQVVQRGPFQVESTQFTTPDGGLYVDQWIANNNGGGQEIVQKGDKKSTRLHAGGVIEPEELAKLGLTKKDVTGYLKTKIVELGTQTRLSADCAPQPDEDWQYSYKVMKHLDELDLTIGLESITYKGQIVFAHGFLNSPVK